MIENGARTNGAGGDYVMDELLLEFATASYTVQLGSTLKKDCTITRELSAYIKQGLSSWSIGDKKAILAVALEFGVNQPKGIPVESCDLWDDN